MKKAQGLSLNTVVIGVIVIIVMIILIAVVGTNIRRFMGSTGSCESQGGICTPNALVGEYPNEACPIPNYVRISGTSCEDNEGETCCVPITNKKEKKDDEDSEPIFDDPRFLEEDIPFPQDE